MHELSQLLLCVCLWPVLGALPVSLWLHQALTPRDPDGPGTDSFPPCSSVSRLWQFSYGLLSVILCLYTHWPRKTCRMDPGTRLILRLDAFPSDYLYALRLSPPILGQRWPAPKVLASFYFYPFLTHCSLLQCIQWQIASFEVLSYVIIEVFRFVSPSGIRRDGYFMSSKGRRSWGSQGDHCLQRAWI